MHLLFDVNDNFYGLKLHTVSRVASNEHLNALALKTGLVMLNL